MVSTRRAEESAQVTPSNQPSQEPLSRLSPAHQFEWSAVDLVNARPSNDHKKGADTGIDAYINFFDDKSGKAKQVIVQVMSGYVGVNHVRDLEGVLEREKAAIGALITLRDRLSTPSAALLDC